MKSNKQNEKEDEFKPYNVYEYLTELAKEEKTEVEYLMFRLDNINDFLSVIKYYAENTDGPFKEFAKYIADDLESRSKEFKYITEVILMPLHKSAIEYFSIDSNIKTLKKVVFFYEPLIIQFNKLLKSKLQDDLKTLSRSIEFL